MFLASTSMGKLKVVVGEQVWIHKNYYRDCEVLSSHYSCHRRLCGKLVLTRCRQLRSALTDVKSVAAATGSSVPLPTACCSFGPLSSEKHVKSFRPAFAF